MNAKEAFEVLLSQLSASLKEAQELGTQAFKKGKFAEAQSAAKRGEELAAQIRQLESMRQKWDSIVSGKLEQTRKQETRAPHGKKTPEKAYVIPILTVLEKMGGRGSTKDVIDGVGEIIKPMLTEIDYEFLQSTHEQRWRNTTKWARNDMVIAGLLLSDSPSGIWEISDAGRAYLKQRTE